MSSIAGSRTTWLTSWRGVDAGPVTSVFGKKGDDGLAAIAGFEQALQNLANVGFCGGCYYGHGVNVSGGTARFTLSEYSIK
jgi:hypothetical protein